MALPTVTDLKVHLNITTDADDNELADVLDAAVEMVAGLIGPVAEAMVTETHYGVASHTLLLRQMPVAELTAVSGYSSTDYVLDRAAGVARLVSGDTFYGDVTVTYSTGRADVPADIRLAILIIAGHLWETQRGISPTPLSLQQPEAFDAGATGLGFAIPNRAKELLAPYVRSVIA